MQEGYLSMSTTSVFNGGGTSRPLSFRGVSYLRIEKVPRELIIVVNIATYNKKDM